MASPLNTALGNAIYRLRQLSDQSQSELAQALDVSQATISYIERGTKINSLDMLNRIAACFGIKGSEVLAIAENAIHDRYDELIVDILEDTFQNSNGWIPLEQVSGHDK